MYNVDQEALTCTKCQGVWTRDRVRGMKPIMCPGCRKMTAPVSRSPRVESTGYLDQLIRKSVIVATPSVVAGVTTGTGTVYLTAWEGTNGQLYPSGEPLDSLDDARMARQERSMEDAQDGMPWHIIRVEVVA